MKPERKAFAASRPLPPFGRLIKAFVEAFQLTDPASYDGRAPADSILEALRIDGTALRYTQGDLLKDSSKRDLLAAVAEGCSRLSWLPLGNAPTNLGDVLSAFAAYYEHSADMIANITLDDELYPRNLARLLAVNVAVRAGALDVLDDCQLRHAKTYDTPTWFDDVSAKKWIRNLVARSGQTRDKFAETLAATESPLDRILGKNPTIPAAGLIRRMGEIFDAGDSAPGAIKHVTQLRRHYAALHLRREFLVALKLDRELLDELLVVFQRVRRAVRSFAQALQKANQAVLPDSFLHLFLTAGQHEVHRPFWAFLIHSEPPSEWTEVYHVQATGAFVAWNESRHAQYAGLREVEAALREGPTALAQLVNKENLSAVRRIKPLIDLATVLEQSGDYTGALAQLEAASKIAPELPGLWHSLGKSYGRQRRWSEAESALRHAIKLGQTTPDIVGDLACTLVYAKRQSEAASLLEQFNLRPTDSGMLGWIWSLVELRRSNFSAALNHAKFAASVKFKPGHSNLIAAEAARALGWLEQAAEHEKRARELGWDRENTPLFDD